MATYTTRLGTTHTVPTTWNKVRKGQTVVWGNSNGGDATRKRQDWMLAHVVPMLALEVIGENAYRAVCGCPVAANGTAPVIVDSAVGPVPLPVVEADRALTEGDANAPYAPGLIVPVCPRHNGSSITRREVAATIRAAAERVARAYAE